MNVFTDILVFEQQHYTEYAIYLFTATWCPPCVATKRLLLGVEYNNPNNIWNTFIRDILKYITKFVDQSAEVKKYLLSNPQVTKEQLIQFLFNKFKIKLIVIDVDQQQYNNLITKYDVRSIPLFVCVYEPTKPTESLVLKKPGGITNQTEFNDKVLPMLHSALWHFIQNTKLSITS